MSVMALFVLHVHGGCSVSKTSMALFVLHVHGVCHGVVCTACTRCLSWRCLCVVCTTCTQCLSWRCLYCMYTVSVMALFVLHVHSVCSVPTGLTAPTWHLRKRHILFTTPERTLNVGSW